MTSKFVERICEYQFAFYVLSVLVFTLAVLTVISFPALERGTPEFTIALYNSVVLFVFIVGLVGVRMKCGG